MAARVSKQMVDAYNEVGGNIIAVDEVPQDRVNQYGVIDPVTAGDSGPLVKMKGMVEKPPVEKRPEPPQDHRPLHPAARSVRSSCHSNSRSRRRDPAHRRDAAPDGPTGLPRLRARRQGL